MQIAPLPADHFALSHLPKQMGAAAGGMLFLARGAKAWAHHSALILPAFPHPDTTQSCLRQTAIVMRKFEMSFRHPRLVVLAKTKVLIHLVGQHELAGIHFPLRVPQYLEPAKSLHQFGAKHFWQKLGACLTVPMLAGERAAVGKNQIRRLFHEFPEFLYSVCRLQIEAQAIVNATVSEMPIQRVAIFVGLCQLAQVS